MTSSALQRVSFSQLLAGDIKDIQGLFWLRARVLFVDEREVEVPSPSDDWLVRFLKYAHITLVPTTYPKSVANPEKID